MKTINCPHCGAGAENLRLDAYVNFVFRLTTDENGNLVVDMNNIPQPSGRELIEDSDEDNLEVFCSSCGSVFNASIDYSYLNYPIIIEDNEEDTGCKLRFSNLIKTIGEEITRYMKKENLKNGKTHD